MGLVLHAELCSNLVCVAELKKAAYHAEIGMAAEKRWRRIQGFHHLAKVIAGGRFKNGIEVGQESEQHNAA